MRLEFPRWTAVRTTLLALACAATHASAAFINNGSFTNGPQSWVTYDTDSNTLVQVDFTATGESGLAGDRAARVTVRDNAVEGIKQDVLTALLSGPGYNGRTFLTRFSAKLDAPASVRCYLQLKSGQNDTSPPWILAEQVVRATNQWVRLEGVRTIAWSATPIKGYLYFEVQQYGRPGSLATTPLPDYEIDNVTMDLDDDGDGLSNAEEAQGSPATDPANPDSDGDHMPDGWEQSHGTQPMTPDGQLDSDGDGFTNLEEYYAATDPLQAGQKPGVPADAQADPYARALLRYLALLPSKRYLTSPGTPARHVAIGQMISDALPANASEANAYSNNVVKLAAAVETATGSERWPAILGMAAEHNQQPLQIQEDGALAESWLKAGGIVQIKFRPWNPWTQTQSGTAGIDLTGLLQDTNDPAHVLFQSWLTQIADEFERLKDPERGGCADAVILFRPFSEMNGNWFWWGQLSREDYTALWRYVYTYMTVTRGLHHLLWVYESDSSQHAPDGASALSVASDYYYPGDDVVDVMGHNLYSDTWDLDFDEQAVYRRYPKVSGVPQAGSAASNPPSNGIHRATGSFDDLLYLEKIERRYPRLSFFIVWNSFGNTTTNQYVNIVDNLNAVALMTNDAVVTRADLA
jgi:Glycosyl hydrolase family 26/Carbohydrate binding domain/Bacterial TSP3 repeat